MKKIVTIFTMLLVVLSLSSCYDRDVLDDKGLNYFIPTPENVQYIQDNATTVTLTWSIPSVIPEDFRRPISVQIQIVENNIYRDRITLVSEETSHTFTIDPAKKYRYIVKLVGTFTEENQETGRTSTVTSEGVIVNVE